MPKIPRPLRSDTAGPRPPVAAPADRPSLAGDEQALIARIRLGDTDAFEGVFRAYSGPLFAFAREYVGARELAEEVVQDVFLRVWQRRAVLTVEGSIATYLYAAARNAALNVVRRGRLESRWHVRDTDDRVAADVPGHDAGPDAVTDAHARDAAISAAVAELSPRCRQAFLLRWGRRMSHAEVASAMGTSVKTVEKQLGVAFRVLRSALRSWAPD